MIFNPNAREVVITKLFPGTLTILMKTLILLYLSALLVYRVISLNFNMRVCDHNKSPVRICYLLVHFFQLRDWKLLIVKFKVFKISRVSNIHPQHVNLKLALCKQVVAVDHCLSSYFTPFAEVVAQTVRRR